MSRSIHFQRIDQVITILQSEAHFHLIFFQPVTPHVQSKHRVFGAHNLWQITASGRWLLVLINYESALSHLLSVSRGKYFILGWLRL